MKDKGRPEARSARAHHRAVLPIVLTYVAIGLVWIYASDRILGRLTDATSSSPSVWFQTAKGGLYVVATGGLLYALVFRMLRRRAVAEAREAALREALLALSRLFLGSTGPTASVRGMPALLGRAFGVPVALVEWYDAPRDEMVRAAAVGLPDGSEEARRTPTRGTPSGEVARTRRPKAVIGSAPDERYGPDLHAAGASSFACAPIIAEGRVIGTLTVADRRPRADLVDRTGELETIANHLALELARRRSEEALAESERRYRLIADNSTDVIWAMDLERRFTYVSPSVAELRGFTADEVMGQRLDEVLLPESHPAAETTLARLFANHAASGALSTEWVELCQRRRDGGSVWTEVTARLTVDEAGRPSGIIGVARDVSERRAAREALRASEERFRLAAESAGDVIYERDLATDRIEYFGDIDTRQGYPPGGFPRDAAGWVEHCHPDDRASVARVFEDAVGPRRRLEVSYRLRRQDGSYTEWVDHATAVLGPDGAPRRIVGAAAEVTAVRRSERERSALADQLQQAMKMEAIGRLAGGVAHDFNNLLTAISGNVQLAEAELDEGSPVREALGDIASAARSAAELTRQLLAFSRKQLIAPKTLELSDLVGGTRRLLGRLLGEDVELRVVLATEPISVRADPGQLEQVLVNLAVNARDAMASGGILTVATSLVELGEAVAQRHPELGAGRYACLSVTDTGTGMSDEVKAHLFEPFFTTKRRGEGTGLGLATTYGAVRQNGGAIDVDSELGRGTTFRILLPLAPPGSVVAETNAAPVTLPGGHETVLLVEDEAMVRTLARRILERVGYRVLSAGDGAEALRIAAATEEPIALLLTDVVMPGLNGRELAAQLVAQRPTLRVLYTSGYADDVIARHGAVERGLAFLPKPYTADALTRKVREVLG